MVDTEEELPEIDFDEDFSVDQNEENRQTFVQVDINPSLDESESDEEERKGEYGQEDVNPREIDSDDEAEAELFALLLHNEIDNEDHRAERRSAFKIPVKSERRITIARLINQHMAAMQIEEEEKIVEVKIVEEE